MQHFFAKGKLSLRGSRAVALGGFSDRGLARSSALWVVFAGGLRLAEDFTEPAWRESSECSACIQRSPPRMPTSRSGTLDGFAVLLISINSGTGWGFPQTANEHSLHAHDELSPECLRDFLQRLDGGARLGGLQLLVSLLGDLQAGGDFRLGNTLVEYNRGQEPF